MHWGRGLRAISVAAAGLFVVAACGSTSSAGVTLAADQTLNIRLTTEPSSFDPGQQQWDYEAAVGRQTFEALLRPKQDGSDVSGAAADSYSIDSTGTVYTFKLHPGAKWSDGQAVTASDFVYGFQRLLDPRLAAPYASFYYAIKNASTVNSMDPKDPGVDAALQTLGLAAPDANTFQITLGSPAGYFKWVASLWTSTPIRKDIVQKYGKDSNGNDKWGAVAPSASDSVVGNGLFKVSEDVPKDHVTLVPNSNYAGSQPKPTLTKIVETYIDDETVGYAKYKSGELDMMPVPNADTAAVKGSPELMIINQLTVFWIDFNVKKAPFDNAKVRLAFSEAFNRDQLVNNVLQGRDLAATTLIPKGMRNYRPDLGTPQNFDANAAKANLTASGVSASALNGVKLTYRSSSPTNSQIAQFLQAQLNTNLGINTVLDGTDSKTASHRLHTGDYQVYITSGWGADYPDSQDWFDIFLTGSGNQFSNWSNTQYDAAVNAGDVASDNAKRDAYYETAEKILVSDAPVAFLFQQNAWYLVKPYVKGIKTTPNDDQWLGDFFPWSIQIAQH